MSVNSITESLVGRHELTLAQWHYVRQFAAFMHDSGLPRTPSLVFGFLLVCQPERQSAESLQVALKLSVGSVHTGLKLLIKMGVVNLVRLPNDRRFYYQAESGGLRRLLVRRIAATAKGRELAEQGLQQDPTNQRLQSLYELYAWLETALFGITKNLPPQ